MANPVDRSSAPSPFQAIDVAYTNQAGNASSLVLALVFKTFEHIQRYATVLKNMEQGGAQFAQDITQPLTFRVIIPIQKITGVMSHLYGASMNTHEYIIGKMTRQS